MQSQQIEIQSSITNQYALNQLMSRNDILGISDPPQLNSRADNCYILNQQTKQKNDTTSFLLLKSKLKKLQQLYNQGVEKLKNLNQQNQSAFDLKIQEKYVLEQQMKIKSSELNDKQRKGSQSSTAGEDEETKIRLQEKQLDKGHYQAADQIQGLQQKLLLVRKQHSQATQQELRKINKLKNIILNYQNIEEAAQSQQIIQNSRHSLPAELRQRVEALQEKKKQLQQSQQSMRLKVNQTKRSIIHFSNSIEYLRSTQSCCQQILNEELCSLQYKIQGKRIEYESNKRYLDKVIRTRKYQENVSFQEIRNEIEYLNDYCEDMMEKKKNYYGPEIKKYKQKRLQIIEQIKEIKNKYTVIQNQKRTLQLKIKDQNKAYDQLQDEYCALLEKADQKSPKKPHELSAEEKVSVLKDKQQLLTQELRQLLSIYQEIKTEIQNDNSLVPQNIIKDFKKKIQNTKHQIQLIFAFSKQNNDLEKQNKILSEEKEKLEWKTNPDIQKLINEEKELMNIQKTLKESLKLLKQQNQGFQDKIIEIKQTQKLKKQENFALSKQQQLSKSQLTKEQNQINQKNDNKNASSNDQNPKQKYKQKQWQQKMIKKQNQSLRQKDKTVKKKSKNSKNSKDHQNGIGVRQYQEAEEKKKRGFFVKRESPLEVLRGDFPLNGQQDAVQNLSLLSSNPALYMFVIFVTVVIPGLCIGYNF